MSKAKHTLGPWAINPKASLCVEGPGGRGVASTGGYFDNTSDGAYEIENQANARLISSAPDLLEALELADAVLSGLNMNMEVVERKIRNAIAKAKGITP
jgi:hypothetical protein